MTYALIGLLAILVIGGGITFMVLSSTKQSTPASPDSADETPLGDTSQHAGEQSAGGETVSEQDADRGGTGAPTSGPKSTGRQPSEEPDEPSGGRFKRDPIGGEGEGETTVDVGDPPRAG